MDTFTDNPPVDTVLHIRIHKANVYASETEEQPVLIEKFRNCPIIQQRSNLLNDY